MFDMAFTKIVPLKESRVLEFRAQATNIFNMPQYAAIDTPCNSPTFGRVTGGGRDAAIYSDVAVSLLRRHADDASISSPPMPNGFWRCRCNSCCFAPSLPAQQQADYTFHAQTDLVLVNVTVRDKNGNFVRGLKPEDFTDS